MNTSHLKRAAITLLAGVLLNVAGCSVITDTEVTGTGIGAQCVNNSDCHAGQCLQGLCTAACNTDADCPAPTTCQTDKFCAKPMKAGFMYIGVLADQGWSYMHDQGRLGAEQALPYLKTEYATNVITDDQVTKAAEDMIAKGANVIVQTSQGGTKPMAALVAKYPGVDFLQLYNRTVTPPNLGSYWVKLQQSWYIAGYVAARVSKTHRLSWIGGFVSPQGLVRANGFVRGALAADPTARVDIRWVGFWFDPGNPVNGKYREELLTEEAIASGSDVIIGNLDNERLYDVVESAHNREVAKADSDPTKRVVYSIQTNNPNACAKYPNSCLGVAWLNWTPIYVQQLDAIHRLTWNPGYVHVGMARDPGQSPVGFTPSSSPLITNNVKLEVDNLVSKIVDDPEMVLRGPYKTTGQRPDVTAGEVISDDELLAMCWLAEGAYEGKTADAASVERPAQVPRGERTFLDPNQLSPETKSLADPPDCTKNL